MFEEVKSSIDNENYDQAKEKLGQLLKEGKNELWIRYYQALILEKQGYLEESEANYRLIVKDSIYPDGNLLKLIRDAIERIVKINQQKQKINEDNKKEIKTKKLQDFQNSENSEDLAVLVLQPVKVEEKKFLAPKFAQIMGVDNYSAILQIPTRSLRLYKTGNLGTLNYYQSELSQAEIPCFCQRIKDINNMNIYQVLSITRDENEVNILCEDAQEKEINIIFQWEEIDNRIEALIPIFEMTLYLDARGKPQKKKSTLDYGKFYDLHLISQNLILRFSDQFYRFEQGLPITKEVKTVKEKWHYLTNYFAEKIPNKPIWSDFSLFAEGAVQFPEMLKYITAHVNLFRREETLWDEAFQLYSGLIFLHKNPPLQ